MYHNEGDTDKGRIRKFRSRMEDLQKIKPSTERIRFEISMQIQAAESYPDGPDLPVV